MQHLLDFIHENTLERQLYLVVAAPEGDLELSWQHTPGADGLWHVRPYRSQEPGTLIHYGDLLDFLESLGADMQALQRELEAMVITHVAFADGVLREARQVLGADLVQRTLADQRAFALQLRAAVTHMIQPVHSMRVFPGGGALTSARTGHLTLVRSP
jgi:hypothetical protein